MRRYSIRTLMAFVLFFGVGLAALRNANELWAGMMLLTALAAVGVAVLGAAILRGRERSWWGGFALFGGGYLALAVGPWLSDTFEPQLGTTQVLRYAHDRMNPSPVRTEAESAALQAKRDQLAAQIQQTRRVTRSGTDAALLAIQRSFTKVDQQLATLKVAAPPYGEFRQVGHGLFALLAGLVGAVVAGRFHDRRERTASDPEPA